MPWWVWVIVVLICGGLFDYLVVLTASKGKKVKE